MLWGAQSIWIHPSNCKNCPQQSLQLQWAHAPHSSVHFFRFEKRRPVWAAMFTNSQCFCLLSAANPLFTTINNHADEHCAPPFLSFYVFSPFLFQFCFLFFQSLVRPLESVCYWAQSVKVSSCKVCEVCSVCLYEYLYLCLCVFVFVFICVFVFVYVYVC